MNAYNNLTRREFADVVSHPNEHPSAFQMVPSFDMDLLTEYDSILVNNAIQ